MRCGNERPYFTVAGTKAQGGEETFLRWHVSGRDEIETQALGPWSVWLTQLCSVQCSQPAYFRRVGPGGRQGSWKS